MRSLDSSQASPEPDSEASTRVRGVAYELHANHVVLHGCTVRAALRRWPQSGGSIIKSELLRLRCLHRAIRLFRLPVSIDWQFALHRCQVPGQS